MGNAIEISGLNPMLYELKKYNLKQKGRASTIEVTGGEGDGADSEYLENENN